MKTNPISNSTAGRGMDRLPSPAGKCHQTTTRLMQNRLAKRFFDKAPENVQNIVNRFDEMMNNTALMKVLAPKIEEIEKLGPAQIIAQAGMTINNYLEETAFTRPKELPDDNLLVNNFFAIAPNGNVDLGQFLSQNLAALQMIGDPEKYSRYSGAILSRFGKVYFVLRAGEILAGGKIVPISGPTAPPAQATERIERGLMEVITDRIAVNKIENDVWRDAIKGILLNPQPLPEKALLEEAIGQFKRLTTEEVRAEAPRYDHSIHRPEQADLPHPHDAKELHERGVNWAMGILTAFRSDRANVAPADLTEAFRTALVWLSAKYNPKQFVPPKVDFLPSETPKWLEKRLK